ncbi:TetR/AcrR family transcriptional regulator [uncultured Aeromicrobium sp.]|uniref:TetR/AcrR family transcriptional regulator n=1 Tax=uncultured Aeromicrobium sp. TaxID=337820 RepID=UPI0025D2F595|nr:TetR/AcrR family transcriptional regulator [uncultured Aeromicrobium sp.]
MKSRDEVLDAAAIEMMQHGYAASSLSSIAAHLGLTKGALVRRFPTKEHFAWGIIDTLRRVLEEERVTSLEVYPNSGVRAMIRFFLAVGIHAMQNLQVSAAVVLFTDRASPAFELADLLQDWKKALADFLSVAQREGEVSASEDVDELAEYVFVTNMGEAVFGVRSYAPDPSTERLRFIRRTLKYSGVTDADEIVNEVLRTHADGSLGDLPPRSGIARRH